MEEKKYYPVIDVTLIAKSEEVNHNKEIEQPFTTAYEVRRQSKIYDFKRRLEHLIYQLNAEGTYIKFEEFGIGDTIDTYNVFINAKDAITEINVMSIIEGNIKDIKMDFRYSKVE